MNILSLSRGKEIILLFDKIRIMVIGDIMLDHFIWGTVERISPEAPVPVVEVTSESMMLGGAANVANNISSLDGMVMLAGILGKDLSGEKLVNILETKGIETDGIVFDERRPTSVKTRIIAHSQQVVRFDREKRKEIDAGVILHILNWVEKHIQDVNAIVVSDYAKGVVTRRLVEGLLAIAKASGKIIVVDPKVKHFSFYRGATLITPNTVEASKASGIEIVDEDTLHHAGMALLKDTESGAILITQGEHGMTLFERDGNTTHIPTVAKEVYDVTGAGDTVVATCALALASGATLREAAVLSNYAAGIVVGEVGTAVVSRSELMDALENDLTHD